MTLLGRTRRRRLAGKLLAVVDAIQGAAAAQSRGDLGAEARQQRRLADSAVQLAEYLTAVLTDPPRRAS